MMRSTLPKQIVILAFAVLIAVLASLWVSIFLVRQTMNSDAAEESQRRIGGRVRALQEQVALIASDYHNWTDIFLNARDQNYERLASNYGITADRGDIFQYAELFDGPFPSPVAWRQGQGRAPQPGFIDEPTRPFLRQRVSGLDPALRQTIDYFELRDGNLVMYSSSYLLPEDEDVLSELDPAEQAIAVIGKVLTPDRLADIEAEFDIEGLRVVEALVRADTVSVPAVGISGEPAAWLEWYPPTPGTVLFGKMAPIMAVVSLIFAATFYWGTKLLRANATKLIAQEAVSFDQARTDVLTGLPNRLALREHLESITADGTMNCAVMVMDLDRFKQVNDTVGHMGGDLYLRTFASRLKPLEDDRTFVARLGGDEFVLVMSSPGPVDEIVKEKCAELAAISREQICCNGVSFDVMASKGLATLEADELSADELLGRADRAMYAGKVRGTQTVTRYDDDMEGEDREHKAIESRLRSALIDGEGFSIEYQPIVSAGDIGTRARFEALARWHNKDCGRVPPDKFIHVAETSGLIVRLGWLLLDMICRDIRDIPNCKFGVNISPAQLMTPGFAEAFAARVKANGVTPEQIEVEVTEQVVVRDDTTIVHELSTLRRKGFTLALDDFGTGYSSIGYLTKMPFDVLKIDRSFTRLEADNLQFRRMIHSMVGLARAMDLTIIAEGIETREQSDRFRALGIDFLQGFYFGRPAPLIHKNKPSIKALAI